MLRQKSKHDKLEWWECAQKGGRKQSGGVVEKEGKGEGDYKDKRKIRAGGIWGWDLVKNI